MVIAQRLLKFVSAAIFLAVLAATPAWSADGVFVRFQLVQPTEATYFVRLGGFIHKSPWYLPRTAIPGGADKDATRRISGGQFTDWFDLRKFAGERLHGRLHRAGGVAELPNVTADFVVDPPAKQVSVTIELATGPDPGRIVKRWQESFTGSLTSFLVSPDLRRDADSLETAAEMTARRLEWARQATGNHRNSPRQLIVQTSFWSPQRLELNLQEAEVLHLLGFNIVGNQRPEVLEKYSFGAPGHTHSVRFGPAATRDEVDESMTKHVDRFLTQQAAGSKTPDTLPIPFGFADEVCCRPPIGEDPLALAHFHAWLAEQKIAPKDLGVAQLTDVVPLESPEDLPETLRRNAAAARRVFYYSSRFRQQAASDRVAWHTTAFHKALATRKAETKDSQKVLTSTLVADHPYFAGSGMGMGMTPNPTWGGYPLTMDWFDLARRPAVDLAGIEDWMGLQYMYGPNTTWEGFQLMGFQASIFRSGSRGQLPIIAWITPSDETNLRLKTTSALCQGAKHFFYWTYGPTATSTENYWSDLRGSYDGIAAVTRQLAAGEQVIAPGRLRKTRVALLYSISSDLWQPFGYVHMLERRGTYLSLVHDQYLVDMLTEEDVATGRLDEYDVLYAVDPCIKTTAAERIAKWVTRGGHLYATTAAGSRNEFNEPSDALSATFGIESNIQVEAQPGRYHIRGALNNLPYLDQIQASPAQQDEHQTSWISSLGAIGTKIRFVPTTAHVVATYQDGTPAVVENTRGQGRAVYIGTSPALAYIKEARFVPSALAEQWPLALRSLINRVVSQQGAERLVRLSHPVVEAGVYDSEEGTALVLANFTYQPIEQLEVAIRVPRPVTSVRSTDLGRQLPFEAQKADGADRSTTIRFTTSLELSDVLLLQ